MDEQEREPREISDFGVEVEQVELMRLGHTPLTYGHVYRVDRPHSGSWQQIGIVSEEPATVSAGTFTFDETEEMSITGWQTNVAPKVDMKRLLDQDAISVDEEIWGIYIPDDTSVIIALVQQLTYRTVVVTPLYIPSSLSPYCAAAHIFSDQSFHLLSTSEGSRKTLEQEVATYIAEKAANQAPPQEPEQ